MARPVGAGVLTILGGLFILAGGAILAFFGTVLAAFFGIFSGLFFVGVVVGFLTLVVGVLMISVPSGHTVWGVLAVLFAIVSIPFAFGGFILGFLFALLGGVLAILWRPPRVPAVITVEARTVTRLP